MTQVHSFPPIETWDARVLVLGTMPGDTSLRTQQYYGHPRNSFWRIVGEVLGFDSDGSYEQRKAALRQRKVALWDVLASCLRPGSLDSSIDSSSVVPNDFATFFSEHPHIHQVCFNGAKAEGLYMKRVLPLLALPRVIVHVRLPSTSPANAGMPLADKVQAWRRVAVDAG